MSDITQISAKGTRHNLQFPTAMREKIIAEAGFTDEEIEILNLRARGKSIVEIAMLKQVSVETINRRIKRIKQKIQTIVT